MHFLKHAVKKHLFFTRSQASQRVKQTCNRFYVLNINDYDDQVCMGFKHALLFSEMQLMQRVQTVWSLDTSQNKIPENTLTHDLTLLSL